MNDLRSLREENYADDLISTGCWTTARQGLLERLYALFGLREALTANLAKNFPDGAAPNVHHVTAFDGDGLRRVVALLTTAPRRRRARPLSSYLLKH